MEIKGALNVCALHFMNSQAIKKSDPAPVMVNDRFLRFHFLFLSKPYLENTDKKEGDQSGKPHMNHR